MPKRDLTVGPISAAEHLAFVRAQRSVSFLQTPAWGRVKTEWRSESLGWFDGTELVGAGLVLHRPVPQLEEPHTGLPARGPGHRLDRRPARGSIRWSRSSRRRARSRCGWGRRCAPTWGAAQVKEGFADPGVRRLTAMAGRPDAVGVRLSRPLREPAGCRRALRTASVPAIRSSSSRSRWPAGALDDVLAGHEPAVAPQHQEGGQGGRRGQRSARTEAFHDLYVHTADRDHFTPRPLSYFEMMVAAMRAEDPERIRLYFAHHEGTWSRPRSWSASAATLWYSYGASRPTSARCAAPTRCQWGMIRDAWRPAATSTTCAASRRLLDETTPTSG